MLDFPRILGFVTNGPGTQCRTVAGTGNPGGSLCPGLLYVVRAAHIRKYS
jgi:hypothetical protein